MASPAIESMADDNSHELQMTKEKDPARAQPAAGDDDDDATTMHTPMTSPAQSFDEPATPQKLSIAPAGKGSGSGSSTTGLSPNTSNSSGGSSSTDPDPNATIPQWKKELIQRRKANIARTIGANQIKGTTNSSSATTPIMAAGTTTAKGSAMSPTSPVLTIAKAFCNDSISPMLMTTPTTTKVRGGHSSSSIASNNNGASGRSPDIIQQHDASNSGGHYPASQSQQQLPSSSSCVDTIASSMTSGARSPSKTTSGTGFDTTQFTTTDGGVAATTTRSGGTCLTTSPQNDGAAAADDDECSPSTSSRSAFSNHRQAAAAQLHSRLDAERFVVVAEDSNSSSPLSQQKSLLSTSPQSEQCNSVATAATVSSSFIKNPHVNKSSNKFSKYKSSSPSSCAKPLSSSSSNGTAAGASIAGVNNSSATSSATATVISGASPNSVNNNCLSVPSVPSASGRKMVAAQELSDGGETFDDFDPTEELQYGPGIVSKLRCRYLSLALRQTAAKQRPALDNLRRATSLNNLLDDDDRGSNSSCTTVTDHTGSSTHGGPVRPHSENLGKTQDEFVSTFQKNPNNKLTVDKPRAWNTKRGNDSLKRARSVEALLVYGDPENGDAHTNGVPVQMRYSYMQPVECTKNDIAPIGSSTDVTIEDKIMNARERNSFSEKPPRKISPFMDETERPPPDVVKQTLKIFEATANRRGRGLSRNNCNGEVATKVRNYKSIISQEKPPIIYPKPPLSPKKNFRKPGTPPGSLDFVPAKTTTVVSSLKTTLSGGGLSPTNNISKKFLTPTCAESVVDSTANNAAEPKSAIGAPVPSVRTTLPFRLNSKNESTPIRGSDGSSSPSTPDIIPRKVFDAGANFGGPIDSPVSQLTKQIGRLKIDSPVAMSSPSVGAISPIAKLSPRPKPLTSDSDDGEGDDDTHDDDLDGQKVSKRISKSALDNISKAGTTQQFNFSGSNAMLSSKPQVTVVNGNSNSTASPQPAASMVTSAKQIGVIRPLVAEPKPLSATDNNKSRPNAMPPAASDYTSHTDELITAKARDNLVISNLSQQQQQQQQTNSIFTALKATGNSLTSNNSTTNSKSIDFDDEPVMPATLVLQSHQQQQLSTPPPPAPARPTLTSREIEKNLINMKKIEEANLLEATTNNGAASNNDASGVKWQFAQKKKPRSTGAGAAAQQQSAATQNTMIFNFKDRKEVPDYIENDGLLFRRKRELPKPNESGFVLLGDLSLETSTDTDDDWTMGPPSPCDVEFENANVIIDGKSSIRCRSRDVSLRVQFDDTLTSTFEYPSESSFYDDTPIDNANNGSDHTTLMDIITASATSATALTAAIDTNTVASTAAAAAATSATITTNTTTEEITQNMGQKLLGSMSLDYPSGPTNMMLPQQLLQQHKAILLAVNRSAPLGSYIPMKAQINTKFELGVTRNPDSDSDDSRKNGISNKSPTKTTTTNGNSPHGETKSKTNGVDYILNGSSTCNTDEPESLQYLKPASDDLTVAYSEGTQKTDLLY